MIDVRWICFAETFEARDAEDNVSTGWEGRSELVVCGPSGSAVSGVS